MALMRSYTAIAVDEGMRADVLCAERGLYASRSAAARACDEGRVLLRGQPISKKHAVRAGDVVVYEVDEEPADTPLVGQPIPLDIRYEDDAVIVLSKQAGLVCHPAVDHADGTLVNALIYRFGAQNLCSVQGDRDRLGIVHRLDRDTSGLMLAAKTDEAGLRLMEAIRLRAVDRHYLALVHGIIARDTGMIDAPIARSWDERTRMAVRDIPQARDALTTFNVLERFAARPGDDGYTLVDCKLFTGRTHQIRVHMEFAGHPLAGEPVYRAHAPKDPRADLGLERQFLHSYKLGFQHPVTGEELLFSDGLPQDLQSALHALADRSCGRTEMGAQVLGRP